MSIGNYRYLYCPVELQTKNGNSFYFRAWLDKRNEDYFREKSTNVEVNSTNVRDNFCIFRQLLEATAYLHSNGKRSNSYFSSVPVLCFSFAQTVSGIVFGF